MFSHTMHVQPKQYPIIELSNNRGKTFSHTMNVQRK